MFVFFESNQCCIIKCHYILSYSDFESKSTDDCLVSCLFLHLVHGPEWDVYSEDPSAQLGWNCPAVFLYIQLSLLLPCATHVEATAMPS